MTSPKGHRRRTLAVVVVIILALAIVGGFYYYTQYYLQPDIQVTNISVPTPAQNPQSAVVVDEGRVSNSGSFDYTSNLIGTYDMVFDNSFSIISAKQVAVNYSFGGTSESASFSVPAGTTQPCCGMGLSPNERLNGTFQVSGGSGNDINFEIVASTCTQNVTFSFTLVNAGASSGFANVSLRAGGSLLGVSGASFWSNRYYVPAGQSVPESGQISIPDCRPSSFSVIVVSVSKG